MEWISELSSQNLSKRAKEMTCIIIIKNLARDFTLVFLQSHTLDSQIQILKEKSPFKQKKTQTKRTPEPLYITIRSSKVVKYFSKCCSSVE